MWIAPTLHFIGKKKNPQEVLSALFGPVTLAIASTLTCV